MLTSLNSLGLGAALRAMALALAASSVALAPPAAQAQAKTSTSKATKKPAAKASSKKPAKKTPARAKPRKNAPPSAIAGAAASPGMLAATAATAAALAGDSAAAAAHSAMRASGAPARTTADILAASPPEAWREPDPQDIVLMEFKLGTQAEPAQVIMELAPRLAPAHVANVRALVRGGFFDGLSVLRVQDNFVTQWGDGGEGTAARPLPAGAQAKVPAEFDAPLAGLPFHALAETDGWSSLNGFVDGFPVAAEPSKTPQGRAWLAHCYGNVGAGRGNEIDSSNGSSLYAVIGQAPRSLDLNITSVGRVLRGIEHLAALPRGGGAMGFYAGSESKPPLVRARLLADVPEAERLSVKVLRTDTPTWFELLHNRRNRSGWFVHNVGRVDLCSTTVPVRINAAAAPASPTANTTPK
ncbi:MAG: peptidylprolyl isomerase [Burkholderiales bacterium]